jgi:dTDP-glucose pyrophosphorylase
MSIENLTIGPDISIIKAMKALSSTAEKCLIVVNNEQELLGTLTDGDLRRMILAGINMESNIEKGYCKTPMFFVKGKYEKSQVEKCMLENKLGLIPIINQKNKVIKYLTWTNVFGLNKKKRNDKFNIPVVIMAGGKGARLEPFTKVLPKPLLPIHEKPIIQHIIERFTSVGVRDFYITVNYKSRILKAFFEELEPNYNVNFIHEKDPLGTAGGLRLLSRKFQDPFIVTNCDIIIDADYKGIYDFHLEKKFDISLVASAKQFEIPYGTCELDSNGCLSHFNEKPKFNFLINTGLYVLNPDVLKLIPKNKFFHITDLIDLAQKKDMSVGVYPISENDWIDVGHWTEYQKAVERL